MPEPIQILPNAYYDSRMISIRLGLSVAAVERARRGGKLRFTRVGHRSLSRGAWIEAWLTGEPARDGAEAVTA